MGNLTTSVRVALTPLYHVPRSQVWEGSRGRQAGKVHLHVLQPFVFGRIRREPGQALCGKSGWYERTADGEALCPRCESIQARADGSLSALFSGAAGSTGEGVGAPVPDAGGEPT